MLIFLLFVSAFLFFIVDRKIRCSFIPGILVSSVICISSIWLGVIRFLVKYRHNLNSWGFGNVLPTRILFTVVIFFLAGAPVILLLLFLGRLIGKPMFRPSNNGKGSEILAKTLYIVAACISGLCGIYLLVMSIALGKPKLYDSPLKIRLAKIERNIGVIGSSSKAALFYGCLLICIFVICLILILTKVPLIKNVRAAAPQSAAPALATAPSAKDPALTVGIILSAVGNVGTWVIAIVGTIADGRVYFFNGYTYTKILCTVCILLMIAGLVLIIIGLIKIPSGKQARFPVVRLIFAILLLIASLGDLVWLMLSALRYIFKIRLF